MEKLTDEEFRIYNRGVENGIKHRSPSQESINAFADMNDKLKNISERFEKNDDCHQDLKNKITDVEKQMIKISGDIAPLNRIMWMVLATMITGFIGSVLVLILK